MNDSTTALFLITSLTIPLVLFGTVMSIEAIIGAEFKNSIWAKKLKKKIERGENKEVICYQSYKHGGGFSCTWKNDWKAK